MYESHFGLREKPFSAIANPRFLYLSTQHRAALGNLEYSLAEQAGITVVTGDVGCGKTTVVRYLVQEVDPSVRLGVLTNTHSGQRELLEWVCYAFGIDHDAHTPVALYEVFVNFLLEEYSRGVRVVLIIDEAHNLSAAQLEQLRMLVNVNADDAHLLQLILVGQPELLSTLKQPGLRQLAQRVVTEFHLRPLELADTLGCIRHRLEKAGGEDLHFDEAACVAVHFASGGVPRLINTLCDAALVYGYAKGEDSITLETMLEVIDDRVAGGILPLQVPVRDGVLDRVEFLQRVETETRARKPKKPRRRTLSSV